MVACPSYCTHWTMAEESSDEELMGSRVDVADNLEAQTEPPDEGSDDEALVGKDGKKKLKKKKRNRDFTEVQLEKRKEKGTQRTGKKSGRPDKVKAGKRRCPDCGKEKNLTEFAPATAICADPCHKTKQNVYNRSFFSPPTNSSHSSPAQFFRKAIFWASHFIGNVVTELLSEYAGKEIIELCYLLLHDGLYTPSSD